MTHQSEPALDQTAALRGDRLLFTPEEAAVVLSVGRTRIYELMGNQRLRSVRIGGSRRIPAAALEAFVDELLSQSTRW